MKKSPTCVPGLMIARTANIWMGAL